MNEKEIQKLIDILAHTKCPCNCHRDMEDDEIGRRCVICSQCKGYNTHPKMQLLRTECEHMLTEDKRYHILEVFKDCPLWIPITVKEAKERFYDLVILIGELYNGFSLKKLQFIATSNKIQWKVEDEYGDMLSVWKDEPLEALLDTLAMTYGIVR